MDQLRINVENAARAKTALDYWEYFVYSQINFINPKIKTQKLANDQTDTEDVTNLQDNDGDVSEHGGEGGGVVRSKEQGSPHLIAAGQFGPCWSGYGW